MNKNIYFLQLVEDLRSAERLLRHAIYNRKNPFADDGEKRLEDCQNNVDRLHNLIRSYKKIERLIAQAREEEEK